MTWMLDRDQWQAGDGGENGESGGGRFGRGEAPWRRQGLGTWLPRFLFLLELDIALALQQRQAALAAVPLEFLMEYTISVLSVAWPSYPRC
jgi:hypothetical protein